MGTVNTTSTLSMGGLGFQCLGLQVSGFRFRVQGFSVSAFQGSGFEGFRVDGILRGSWDLVSRVISTLIKVTSRYNYSYPTYNPTY